jgi:hypothetical protein
MSSSLEQLLSLRDDPQRFSHRPDDLLPVQIEAANERLGVQIGRIPLLANRVESAGRETVKEPDDLVPLLFAHSTYKTYAESWLLEGRWDRMARWLSTVSTYESGHAGSFEGVAAFDDWIDRLEGTGRFVACSSGTTGKPAMLGSTEDDIDFGAQCNVSAFSWSTGIGPNKDRKFFGLGPPVKLTRNELIRRALIAAFGSETAEPYQLPVPPISAGSVMGMVMLRRRIADGTAQPSEVAEFELVSTERQAIVDAARADAVDALIKARAEPLFLSGFLPHLYPLAHGVRERGYSGDQFDSSNVLFTAGGLKGVSLLEGYREFILETFGVSESRLCHFYSMQEVNTCFPRCTARRYHVAPWVLALPLDDPGEQLLDASKGAIDARAAFLDLSLEGRWGGVISGDRVNIDFAPCACGNEGPHIGLDIVRYADLEGGDKITCAGTIDAYVRGAA